MIKRITNFIKSKLGVDQVNLLSHSKNYVLASYAKQAFSIISTPIITRYLTLEQYGALSIVTSVTYVFTVLMTLNFTGAVAVRYHEKDSDYKNFMGSITNFLIIYNLVFVFIIYLFRETLSGFFNIHPYLFMLGIFTALINVFITLYLGHLQTTQNSKKHAKISFSMAVLAQLLSLTMVITFKQDKHLGRIYGNMIINSLYMVYSIRQLYKIGKFKLDFSKVRYAATYGIPLIPHALSAFILSTFDRIIINQIEGQSAAGLYSFAYTIGVLMNLLISSINKAWVPAFYKNYGQENFKKISHLAENNVRIIFFGALGLILFAKELVMIFADSRYHEALRIVPVIIFSYVVVFLYYLYSNYAFYKKKTLFISISTLAAGTVNIILNYIFIPRFGYIAAAYTTLASYICLFVFHYINTKFVIKANCISAKIYIWKLLVFVVFCSTFFVFDYYINNFIIMLIIKIIILILYTYIMIKTYKQSNKKMEV